MNILITGTSSGLGKALASHFHKAGANVYGLSRSHSNLDISQEICDFVNLESITKALNTLTKGVSVFDYVFLNAGVLGRLDTTTNISIYEYTEVFNINVWSNKIILDNLLTRCRISNVIGISSGASLKTYLGWSLYCTSKAAFKQLLSSYGDESTTTNFVSLAPGLIKSKMQKEIQGYDVKEFPSLQKFHDAYDFMKSPDTVANNIINNLSTICKHNNDYIDLRDIINE